MARESFESTDIAHILNDKFVCVKVPQAPCQPYSSPVLGLTRGPLLGGVVGGGQVDREERPDIDAMLIQFLEQATGGGRSVSPRHRSSSTQCFVHEAEWEGRASLV